MPVVLTNAGWESQRHTHLLMQRHSNLHLEFSSLQANRILEYLVRDFGDTR